MSSNSIRQARLTTITEFAPGFVPENIVVRSDNSLLITVANRHELWFVPSVPTPDTAPLPVTPQKLFTFAMVPTGIVEGEPDVFYISTGAFYNSNEAFLERLDLRGWLPGKAVQPERVLQFPAAMRGLNGSCLIAPGVILLADSFAGLIWRVDLFGEEGKPTARIWLQHESMGYYAGQMKPEQPGINGIRYAARLGYVYYTATAKKLFMRVKVNPETLEAAGEPEHVSVGRMADDFCIDEEAGVAYLTTHRENTIDLVSLDPARNNERFIAAGDPFTEDLIGPTSAAWRRSLGAEGRVAYVTTDGGTISLSSNGIQRPAKILQVKFSPVSDILRKIR